MPTAAEIGYVLDLADEILREDGDRWHAFAWLVVDADAREAGSVDSYWRGAQLIADVVDTDADERRRQRAAAAAAFGLTYVLIDVRRLRTDAAGRLRRVREHDAPIVRTMLQMLVAEDEHDQGDDEWAAARAGEWVARPSFDPGWRARGIALAALGAAVLSRRAFAAWQAGYGLDDVEVQVLAALALLEGDAHESQLATILALPGGEIAEAAQALRARALAEEQPDDPADPDDHLWGATDSGVAAVQEWIGKIVPLFGGWPPHTPGVDDATG